MTNNYDNAKIADLILSREDIVRTDFIDTLDCLTTMNSNVIYNSLKKFGISANLYLFITKDSDVPTWLYDLTSHVSYIVEDFKSNPATIDEDILKELFQYFSYNFANATKENWIYQNNEKRSIDVDFIFENSSKKSDVNQLFEKLIGLLTSLSESEDLDSKNAIEDLQKLIEILRHSTSSSFHHKLTVWQFTKKFIPNLIGIYLSESSMLGPIIEAYKTTAIELDLSFEKIRSDATENITDSTKKIFLSKAISSVLPKLFITDNSQ